MDPRAVVAELYEALSFAPGGGPDWDRLLRLFAPQAQMVTPHRPGVDGPYCRDGAGWQADFVANLRQFRGIGYHVRETSAEVREFRDIAHVMSAYELRHDASESEAFLRGTNSIQLMRTDGRWQIVSVVWDTEP